MDDKVNLAEKMSQLPDYPYVPDFGGVLHRSAPYWVPTGLLLAAAFVVGGALRSR
jgi:hypothetical protein